MHCTVNRFNDFLAESCCTLQLKDVAKNKFKTAQLLHHCGHSEWVRQGNILTIKIQILYFLM